MISRRVALLALVCVASALGCGPKYGEPLVGVNGPSAEAPVIFAFRAAEDVPSGRTYGTESYAGAPLLVVFATLDDLRAQAQLVALARAHKERPLGAPVLVVFVVDRSREELVVPYARTLELPFALAIADEGTARGEGPFAVAAVPTLALLDGGGRLVWKNPGLAPPADVRTRLEALGAPRR